MPDGFLDDFQPVSGPSIATLHRQWLDRGLPPHTWAAWLERQTVADLTENPRALTGSPKQVEWATRIREESAGRIAADVAKPARGAERIMSPLLRGSPAIHYGPALERIPTDYRPDVTRLLIGAALRQANATWWIDNRNDLTYAAINALDADGRGRLDALLAQTTGE